MPLTPEQFAFLSEGIQLFPRNPELLYRTADGEVTALRERLRDAPRFEVQHALMDMGYAVALNAPYAGGYTTEHYGRPARRTHALQPLQPRTQRVASPRR